ncbi:MAG: helix-turn-helix domain-containing protein [Bacilli bacterium]
MEQKYFKTIEFAKIAGVSRQCILKWINNGTIVAFRLGRDYKIPLEEINKFKKVEIKKK